MRDVPLRLDGVAVFDPPAARRAFSPGDTLRLLTGVALVAGGWLVTELGRATISGLERDLVEAFGRLPDSVERPILGAAQLVTSLVPTLVLAALLVARRWRQAALLLVAAVISGIAIGVVDNQVLEPRLADLLTSSQQREDLLVVDRAWPDSRFIASTTAAVTVAAPWLARRWKRALWGSVGLVVLLRLVAVALPALDVVMALGVGTAVGSLILLTFGSPTSEPHPGELIAALRAAGFAPATISRAESRGGALRYQVLERDGTELVVKLRTPDERDADLLNRLYRRLRYRASEVRAPYATLKRRVEHEALVLHLARSAELNTAEAIRVCTTERGSAFLVVAATGSRQVDAATLQRPGFLRKVWVQVRRLHDAGLAHRQLALESVHVDDHGEVRLRDFDHCETAAVGRELARDIAQLLTETAAVVGPRRAVDEAISVMGAERVGASLRMLQPLALPPTTRSRAAQQPDLLGGLRSAVAHATGEVALDLEELERVKPRTVLVVVVSALAFYSLLPQLVDFDETLDAIGNAEPLWVVAALGASTLVFGSTAMALQGAVVDDLPVGPTLRAQLAASFTALAAPANVGRLALMARFLERLGTSRPEAGAAVALQTVSGLAVHLVVMTGVFIWAGRSSVGGLSLPEGETLLLVFAFVLAAAGVLISVRPIRHRVIAPMWASTRESFASIRQVLRSPARVAELLGGSALTTLTHLTVLVCAVNAFGGGLRVAEIGAAYLGAFALASLAPTPGGLGALESAMIAGFTAFGLAPGIAVSATLTYRLATFWLPIVPGWFTFGWMQRHDEL